MSDLATSLKLRQTRHNARRSREEAGTRGEEKNVIGVCRRLKIWRSSSFGNSSMTGIQDEKRIAPKTGTVDLKSRERKSGSSMSQTRLLYSLLQPRSRVHGMSRFRLARFSRAARLSCPCRGCRCSPTPQSFAASRSSCVNSRLFFSSVFSGRLSNACGSYVEATTTKKVNEQRGVPTSGRLKRDAIAFAIARPPL